MTAPAEWVLVDPTLGSREVEYFGTRSAGQRAIASALDDAGSRANDDGWPDDMDARLGLVVDRVVEASRVTRRCDKCDVDPGEPCEAGCDAVRDEVVEYEVREADGLADQIASLLRSRTELEGAVFRKLRSPVLEEVHAERRQPGLANDLFDAPLGTSSLVGELLLPTVAEAEGFAVECRKFGEANWAAELTVRMARVVEASGTEVRRRRLVKLAAASVRWVEALDFRDGGS